MSGYEPTFGDLYPNEESTPPEVLQVMREMHDANEQELAEYRANPYSPLRQYWQMRTTAHGSVLEVLYNKLGPQEVNLWVFTPTIDDDGQSVLDVSKHVHLVGRAVPVDSWYIPKWNGLSDEGLAASLAELIGMRGARGVVQRLRP